MYLILLATRLCSPSHVMNIFVTLGPVFMILEQHWPANSVNLEHNPNGMTLSEHDA